MVTAADVGRVRLFQPLAADEQARLAPYLSVEHYPQGALIFYEGDPGTALCIVLKGSVTIAKESVDGTIKAVAMIKEQEIFGEGALIDTLPRSATATAEAASSVLVLTRQAFDVLAQEDPQLAITIIRKVAKVIRNRLRKASADLVDLLPH